MYTRYLEVTLKNKPEALKSLYCSTCNNYSLVTLTFQISKINHV